MFFFSLSFSLYFRHCCANMCIYPQSILFVSVEFLYFVFFFINIYFSSSFDVFSLLCQSNLLWHGDIPKSVFKRHLCTEMCFKCVPNEFSGVHVVVPILIVDSNPFFHLFSLACVFFFSFIVLFWLFLFQLHAVFVH